MIEQLKKLNIKVTAENVVTLNRQNELTELQVLQTDMQQKIKDLEAKIAAEQNPGTKAQLQSQLTGLQSQLRAIEGGISTLNKESDFSILEIKLTSTNIFNIGSSWGNIAKTAET